MKSNSYIPEKILYVCKKSQQIKPKFDEVEESFFETKAHPAFPVDPSREKTIETARSWARGTYWQSKEEVAAEFEMVNEPMKLQLIGLEVRSQGGRAWKVIAREKFYVDLREDILLEAILTCGVEKNGFINGEFIWTRTGSQMKLVRVGSALYATVQEADEKKDEKKVNTTDLVPGKVYTNINGDFVFVGFINSATIDIPHYYRYENNNIKNTKSKPSKMQLWYRYWKYEHEKRDVSFADFVLEGSNGYYSMEIVKSKTVYPHDKNETVEIPAGFIELVRQKHVSMKFDDTYSQSNFTLGVMAEYPNPIVLEGKHKQFWNNISEK